MKKLLIATIAAASLVGMQAMANISVSLTANQIYDNTGVNVAPGNTVGLWYVDTSGGTSLAPTLSLGENIAVGALLTGTTDRIIQVNDINNTTGSPGSIGLSIVNEPYGSGPGTDSAGDLYSLVGVTSGDSFGLIWLVNQSLNVTTAQTGHYGEFNDAAGNFSNGWTLPVSGTVSYDMTTESQGGSVPESAGIANLSIVPEPSSVMLVVVGLLGGLGLIRRRR